MNVNIIASQLLEDSLWLGNTHSSQHSVKTILYNLALTVIQASLIYFSVKQIDLKYFGVKILIFCLRLPGNHPMGNISYSDLYKEV